MTAYRSALSPDHSIGHAASPHRSTLGLFALYTLGLIWVIPLHFALPGDTWYPHRSLNLRPLGALLMTNGVPDYSEVILNLLILVPFGFLLAAVVPRWRFRFLALATLLLPLAFEVSQYLLGSGRSDITDLLANTAGGLVGVGIYLVISRARNGAPTPRQINTVAILIGAAVAVLAMSGVLRPGALIG